MSDTYAPIDLSMPPAAERGTTERTLMVADWMQDNTSTRTVRIDRATRAIRAHEERRSVAIAATLAAGDKDWDDADTATDWQSELDNKSYVSGTRDVDACAYFPAMKWSLSNSDESCGENLDDSEVERMTTAPAKPRRRPMPRVAFKANLSTLKNKLGIIPPGMTTAQAEDAIASDISITRFFVNSHMEFTRPLYEVGNTQRQGTVKAGIRKQAQHQAESSVCQITQTLTLARVHVEDSRVRRALHHSPPMSPVQFTSSLCSRKRAGVRPLLRSFVIRGNILYLAAG